MTTMTNIEAARRIAAENHVLLSKESLHAFAEILTPHKFKKGERVLDAGDVCVSMLYIEKGMTRQFYYKYEKDLTEHIGYEGGVIICLESYFKQEPTRLMIETLEPTIAWEIPKKLVEGLAAKNIEIATLYRRFFEESLIESQIKADTLRFEPAHERYNKLLQLHPEILKLDIANAVAVAMKEWAVENGATHFTHWFQPMTGITAEKHDSFINPVGNGGRSKVRSA